MRCLQSPDPGAAASGSEANSGRLPSLDGLRAVSIALVLLGHLDGTANFGRFRVWSGDVAHLGVTMFFVISGFLITRLLIDDETRQGRVCLRRFYSRRALRIVPAFLVYVAVMAGLHVAGIVHLHTGDLAHAITYTVNFEADSSWQIGHLWSLSVEEQFYLLWPFAFMCATATGRIWIAVATVAVGPLARAAAAFFLRGSPYGDLEMFPMVADSLATGCLLACTQGWLEQRPAYLALFRAPSSLGLVVVLFFTNRYMDHTLVDVVRSCPTNIALAILIHRSVARAHDKVGRILNSPALTWAGVLSYSLYLWQQPFLDRHSAAWINAFPQNLLLAVAAAVLSYWMLEKPLLRIRKKLRGTAPVRPVMEAQSAPV